MAGHSEGVVSSAVSRGQGLGAFLHVLRHRNFRLYSTGDGISLIGNWVQRIAIGWMTWQLTQSGTWLGIVSFADLFPAIIFSPIGGVIADRGDPRRMSFLSQSMNMGQATALFVLTWLGWLNIWGLVILSVMRGSIAAINQPARMSLVPALLPRDELPSAIAFSSILTNIARFIGPAIAGLVIAAGGVESAFAINAASYLVLLYALWVIDVGEEKVFPAHRRAGMWSQIEAGYSYVYDHPGIGPLLLIFSSVTVLVRPVIELLPGFAGAVFHRDAQGLAWMTTAMGLGATMGAISMVRRGNFERLVLAATGSNFILSASVLAFTLVPSFWIGLVLLFAFGLTNTTSGIGTQSLVQSAVDDKLRGRVMSLYGVVFRGGPAFGALIMGSLSDHFGLRTPIAIGATLCLFVALWAMMCKRSLLVTLRY